MVSDAVRAYYASFGEREWARLENPADGVGEITFYLASITKLFLGMDRTEMNIILWKSIMGPR